MVALAVPSLFISRPVRIISSAKIAYGVNVDMTALIPDMPYTIRTAKGGNFFDLAKQLGINTLRITDIKWETTGKEYSPTLWHYVFDQAELYHMHVILLLEDGGEYSVMQQANTLLGGYGLARAPALWLVDLYNEPNLSDPTLMTVLREEASYVHRVAPAVPITIGGWKSQIPGKPGKFDWEDPADVSKFINLVNIVSPHLYGFEEEANLGVSPQQWTGQFLNAVRKEASHKQILLEEFGASNGLAPTNEARPTGNPQWQASVYRGVLQEILAEFNQGIIGAVAWIIAPRPPWPHPNHVVYEGDMTGWAFVLDHGQKLLPAASEFSAVAEGKE